MLPESTFTLPIHVSTYDDESSLSLLYRTAQANGVDLADLKRWLGIPAWTPMPAACVPSLAWSCSAPIEQFARNSVQLSQRHRERRYLLQGHEFGKGAINFSCRARICPLCVKRKKYARSSWQLRPICGCVEHSCVLLDRCPACAAQLDWHRPAIDICHCGQFLTAQTVLPPPLCPVVSRWIDWTEARLRYPDAVIPAESFGLPRLLTSLSIDGAFHFIVTIGLQSKEGVIEHADDRNVVCSIGTCALVARGIDRLASIGSDPDRLASLSTIAHFPTFDHWRSAAISQSDRDFVEWAFFALQHPSAVRARGSGRRARGQLNLFE